MCSFDTNSTSLGPPVGQSPLEVMVDEKQHGCDDENQVADVQRNLFDSVHGLAKLLADELKTSQKLDKVLHGTSLAWLGVVGRHGSNATLPNIAKGHFSYSNVTRLGTVAQCRRRVTYYSRSACNSTSGTAPYALDCTGILGALLAENSKSLG